MPKNEYQDDFQETENNLQLLFLYLLCIKNAYICSKAKNV